MDAVVARSTFPSQHIKSTPCLDHFWKLRCRKSACRCAKKYKTHNSRTTFGSCGVEKVHAFVARGTFPSQKCKKLRGSDHFLTFRCRKSAHISKSKCTKHARFGPRLEVEMLKKCSPLWREAHFQVKNVQKTPDSDHFWTVRCRLPGMCKGFCTL